MKTDQVSLTVETNDGRPLRAYVHEGKTYVESHESRSYQLRVKNRTGNRVKAVIAVDSLNILTGKSASDDPNETGYILGPYAEEVFKGWRLDDNQVAAFTFVKRDKSYATETGEGQGNGVIAMRVYTEKENLNEKIRLLQEAFEAEKKRKPDREYVPYPVYPSYPYWKPYWERPYYDYPYHSPRIWCKNESTLSDTQFTFTSTATSAGNTQAFSAMNCASQDPVVGAVDSSALASQSVELKPQGFDMGSSWGGLVKETVTHTSFETGVLIAEISVFYASLEGLKALGVNVSREKAVAFPEPFKRGYCQPPKDWVSGKA